MTVLAVLTLLSWLALTFALATAPGGSLKGPHVLIAPALSVALAIAELAG